MAKMAEGTLDCWRQGVRAQPQAVVLHRPDGTVIHRAELDRFSDSLAESWRAQGVLPRRILALRLPNGVEWASAFLAALKLGAVVAPLDLGLSPADSLDLMRHLKAQALWDGDRLSFASAGRPRHFRDAPIGLCKLTSGSTGHPKPWFFTDAEMLADARQICATMRIGPQDINLGCIPWGHSYGLGNIVYPLLFQGTATTWTTGPFLREMTETCGRVAATVFPTVPTILRAIARGGIESEHFASLRLVISAGARLDPEVAQAFKSSTGLSPHNFYGSTETGGICFDRDGEASLTGRSVGEPIQGVKLTRARGGRFYVESAAVPRYGRPSPVRRHLASDYGSLNPAGELVLEKRSKGFVKIGGYRIHLGQVESRLSALPEIRDACVCTLEQNGESVLAAAIESELTGRAIRALLAEKLPARYRPKKLRVFESLPMTIRGKVDLRKVQASFTTG